MPSLKHSISLNLASYAIPLVAGVITTPFLIKSFSIPEFSVLTLCWALIGYSGLLDLGLSKAMAKTIASGQLTLTTAFHRIVVGIIIATIASLALLALIACIVVLLPQLSFHALPNESNFKIVCCLAFALPATIIGSTARGAFEGVQQFGLTSATRIGVGLSMFLLPLVAARLNLGLVAAIAALAGMRWIVAIILVYHAVAPGFRNRSGAKLDFKTEAGVLLNFGKWVMITNVTGPVIDMADRLFIGASRHQQRLAYYAVPVEFLTKAYIIPGAAISALFPRFARNHSVSHNDQAMLVRAATSIFLLLLGLPIGFELLGDRLIPFWLGHDFYEQSRPIFQIVAWCIPFNGCAQILYAYIQACSNGRSLAILQAVEAIAYVTILALVIDRVDLPTIAFISLGRIIIDLIALYGLMHFSKDGGPRPSTPVGV